MLSLGAREKTSDGLARSFERMASPLLSSLTAYCRSVARNAWDADDLVQETLEKAFARFLQTGGMPVTKAFLYRIASNAWIDRHRRSRETALPPEWNGWTSLDCEDPARSDDLRWAVERAVAHLTPKQRTALILCEAFGLSLQEASERLGTTAGTVKSLLYRARARLKRTDDSGEEATAEPAVIDAYVHALRSGRINAVVALGETSGPAMRMGAAGGLRAALDITASSFAAVSDGTCTAVIGGDVKRVLSFRAGDAIAA